MFEELEREIRRLNQLTVSVPIESDEEGYIDKECPNEECMFQFKVLKQDWADIFKDESVYCPLCGHKAPADSYWTTEQIENARRQAMEVVQGKINRALRSDARTFNKKQPNNSFIKMSMSINGIYGKRVPIPIAAKEALELKIQCDECKAHFSVIGSAYFCPSCGHNSVDRTYDDSLKKIGAKISNIGKIKSALLDHNKDEAEVICRSIIESALSDCVVAFQRYCDALYSRHPQKKDKIPPNAFQNLTIGSDLWKEALGEGYNDWVDRAELDRLIILFQRRHLLAHCEGLVDEKYLAKSGDKTYSPGQRILVKTNDVYEALTLIKKLSTSIKQHMSKIM